MTTVPVYRSRLVYTRFVIHKRRKHGRPRGHKRRWNLRYRETFYPKRLDA